jgi:16S rRNA (guanine(966)-N(2))-methyltransferase RsmD
MRIISGKNKGRKIIAPTSLPVRPTTDMAKESLFNILRNYVDWEDLSVLDLFAGTGNISYEFASRGCQTIVSVDKNFKCTSFIKLTAEKLKFDNLQVLQSDYKQFLTRTHLKWDLIFADPPYDMAGFAEIPDLIFQNNCLNEDGWFILEHDKSQDFSSHFAFHEQRNYGKVNFSFFKHQNIDD